MVGFRVEYGTVQYGMVVYGIVWYGMRRVPVSSLLLLGGDVFWTI